MTVNFLESEAGSTNYRSLCLQLTSELFNSLFCIHNKSPLAKITKRLVIQNGMGHFVFIRMKSQESWPSNESLTTSVFRGPGSLLLIKPICKNCSNTRAWFCKILTILILLDFHRVPILQKLPINRRWWIKLLNCLLYVQSQRMHLSFC